MLSTWSDDVVFCCGQKGKRKEEKMKREGKKKEHMNIILSTLNYYFWDGDLRIQK